MKRAHKEASTAVVIQPRHSLGGKQTSWSSSDDFAKKRMSNASAYDSVSAPPPPPPQPTTTAHAPPLHPHHLSAIDSVRFGSVGRLVRANSAGAVSNPPPANPPQDVLLSGVLMKRAPFFKHWMPRYFVLTKSALVYYSRNPSQIASASSGSELASVEKKYLRGEIARQDVIKVEATDVFKNHPYSFIIVARRRPRSRFRASTRSAFSCMFVHHKESRLSAKKKQDSKTDMSGNGTGPASDERSRDDVIVYYIQTAMLDDRKKWIKALQRWIDGEAPTKLGRAILEYIMNNEYHSSRYENKVGEPEPWGHGNGISPAAQAGRRVEEEHSVLANLIRDMQECQQEDELVFILDQILGEVKDGACSGYVKKLVAAAGEVKLESSSTVWTSDVKAAYGRIMKTLYRSKDAASSSSNSILAAAQEQRQVLVPGMAPASARSSTLNPTVLKPTRQTSDGGASAPEHSFHRLYKLGRKLGSGAYSVVHIATHRETRKQVAVKCIAKTNMTQSDVVSLKHEVEIMRTLNHPNVVPLLDYFEEPRYYYIVTPLCTGGELFNALVKRKSYTEEDARALMKKLVSAISYFHSRGIVHRDLKPENILLKTSAPGAEVMIADFGFARSMSGEKRLTACGTPGYVAPEVVRGEAYGSEVDCWSLGVILYILLCGYPPFAGENHASIFEKVVRASYKFASPDWDEVSEDAKDLVRKLLTVDRSQRLTATLVLEHPWITMEKASAQDKRLLRVNSDLRPALNHMRRQKSLTHAEPKIRPSDMNVDVLELTRLSIDLDVDLLDHELANFEF